jgi:hypothetical protein
MSAVSKEFLTTTSNVPYKRACMQTHPGPFKRTWVSPRGVRSDFKSNVAGVRTLSILSARARRPERHD